jgi:hypothetical protein
MSQSKMLRARRTKQKGKKLLARLAKQAKKLRRQKTGGAK